MAKPIEKLRSSFSDFQNFQTQYFDLSVQKGTSETVLEGLKTQMKELLMERCGPTKRAADRIVSDFALVVAGIIGHEVTDSVMKR